jgi:archaellum biogenesis ATPase FlaH
MEQKLISASLSSRVAWERLVKLKIRDSLSDQGQVLFDEISEFYSKDPEALEVDLDILINILKRKYPKHFDIFKHVLVKENISLPNLLEEASISRKEKIKADILLAINRQDDSLLIDLLQQITTVNQVDEDEDDTLFNAEETFESVLEQTDDKHRIKLLPQSLTQQLDGGVLRQHHILVFANTDIGKTMFALNLSYGFIMQGLKVLYLQNEDPGIDLMKKFYVRLTGMTQKEIREDPIKAKSIIKAKNGKNFNLKEVSPGTPAEIESLLKHFDPDVFIVDQIRNLDMGDSNKVLQMEKAATMMRTLGKRYNKIPISLTQAGGSAEGKTILGRGDVDFSNVGIPGQIDLMIGIGATEEMEAQGRRLLSFPKNKVNGNKTPIPCVFDFNLMRVV